MINKAILLGHLGAKPSLNFTKKKVPVINFDVCTVHKWHKGDNEFGEEKEWHKCVLFGDNAARLHESLEKGDVVYVEGANKTRSWKDSQGVKRYVTEVIGRVVKKVPRKFTERPPVRDEEPPVVEPKPIGDDVPF